MNALALIKAAASGQSPETVIAQFLPNMVANVSLIAKLAPINAAVANIQSSAIESIMKAKQEGRDITAEEAKALRDAYAELAAEFAKGAAP